MMTSVSGKQPPSKPMKDHQVLGIRSSRDLSVEVDCSAGKYSEDDSNNAQMDVSPEKNIGAASKQGIDVELRYACEPTSIQEDCTTSGSHQPENLRIQQRNRINAGERSKRKRWRGRHDDVCCTPSILLMNILSKSLA